MSRVLAAVFIVTLVALTPGLAYAKRGHGGHAHAHHGGHAGHRGGTHSAWYLLR